MTTTTTAMVMISTVVGLVSVLVATMFWKKQATALSSPSVHTPARSAVLITGCSRGIGKNLAESLAQRGYTVLGTVRSQSSYKSLLQEEKQQQDLYSGDKAEARAGPTAGRIHPILLDVTNEGQYQEAVQSVRSILTSYSPPLQLVGIINNAGINPEGDQWKKTTEEGATDGPPNVLSDPTLAEQVLSTNILGCIRVTHAFLPFLQQQQQRQSSPVAPTAATGTVVDKNDGSSGRIILIGSYFGSVAGAIGLPHVYYETSKHALEGLADGMRRGFQQQQRGRQQAANESTTPALRHVDVSLIKPGNILTDMNDYGEGGPEQVTQVVVQALESAHPKHRYYPGTVKGMSSYVLCTIFELLPTWLSDKLL